MGKSSSGAPHRTPIKQGLSDWREQVPPQPTDARATLLLGHSRPLTGRRCAQLRSGCQQKAKERRREWIQRHRSSAAAHEVEVGALGAGQCTRRLHGCSVV